MKVAFVHPDLGIGGAERLVVDAAVGLKKKGHDVIFYTSHHEPSHSFVETHDGTLKVVIKGDFLPRSLFGGFFIFFAILRNLFLAFAILFSRAKYDVIFCDQLAVCIPILRLTGAKILFYCHFPDKYLSPRNTLLKTLYRAPFDFIEEKTTGMSDCILANSRFTAGVFQKAFPSIKVQPNILYPPINLETFNKKVALPNDSPFVPYTKSSKKIILSINRFERKKNVNLAIHAFSALKKDLPPKKFNDLQLIIAGGYDTRVTENVEHLNELSVLATNYGLTFKTVFSNSKEDLSDLQKYNVVFLPSVSEAHKVFLLNHSFCLLYTPANEHFGIVPCEGMYSKLPVIAANSGGPTESVVHGVTGLLIEPEPEPFAKGILKFLSGEYDLKEMGAKGHQRVKDQFSLASFADKLEAILKALVELKKKR